MTRQEHATREEEGVEETGRICGGNGRRGDEGIDGGRGP